MVKGLTHRKSNRVDSDDAVCPSCGSTDVARIVYGYPSDELRDHHAGEKVVFGGCMCWGDARDPQLACRRCNTRFGQVLQLSVFPAWLGDD